MRKVTFEPFKSEHELDYKLNFDLGDKDKKLSYFEYQQKYVRIKTSVPNDKFELKEAYFIPLLFRYKFLFIHISDNTDTAHRYSDINFLMNIEIDTSDIKKCLSNEVSLLKGEEIKVIIFNDNSELNCRKAFFILLGILMENIRVSEDLNNDEVNIFIEKFISVESEIEKVTLLRPREAGGGVIVGNP